MAKEICADLIAKSHRVAIVVSRFNDFITERLRGAAVDCYLRHGAAEKDITVIWVPGAFELPLAAWKAAESERFDAIVALGCVLQGATPHNEHINREATAGLGRVMAETGIPVAYGLLTPNTLEQAIERAGGKHGNKGWEAALSAIEMVNLLKKL